jgi:hypothetical protein
LGSVLSAKSSSEYLWFQKSDNVRNQFVFSTFLVFAKFSNIL